MLFRINISSVSNHVGPFKFFAYPAHKPRKCADIFKCFLSSQPPDPLHRPISCRGRGPHCTLVHPPPGCLQISAKPGFLSTFMFSPSPQHTTIFVHCKSPGISEIHFRCPSSSDFRISSPPFHTRRPYAQGGNFLLYAQHLFPRQLLHSIRHVFQGC